MALGLMLGDIPGIHHQQHLQRLANDVVNLLRPSCLALDPRVVHIGWPHSSKERKRRSTTEPTGSAAPQQRAGGYLPETRSKIIKPCRAGQLRWDDGFECFRLYKVKYTHGGKHRGKPILLEVHAFHGTPVRIIVCLSNREPAQKSCPRFPPPGPPGSLRRGYATRSCLP